MPATVFTISGDATPPFTTVNQNGDHRGPDWSYGRPTVQYGGNMVRAVGIYYNYTLDLQDVNRFTIEKSGSIWPNGW